MHFFMGMSAHKTVHHWFYEWNRYE